MTGKTKELRGIDSRAIQTLQKDSLQVVLGLVQVELVLDILLEDEKTMLGEAALGALDLLVNCRIDRFLHASTQSIIPCFKLHKTNIKSKQFRWKVIRGMKNILKKFAFNNIYLLCFDKRF